MKFQALAASVLLSLTFLVTPVEAAVNCLVQSDFDSGTFIITEPGRYSLCEDIVFNPNGPAPGSLPAEDAFDPDFNVYDKNSFGLGFFSAIAVAASDVTIDLAGHTIKQGEGHALFQRFFAVIELADSPFIKSVGPAQFVGEDSTFNAASNIKVIGPGTIGLSSHHGIHGNENSNVIIQDVIFEDFEVAAVSLNNVDSLKIEGCTINNNRQDVPVVGSFSAARFIRPFGKKLKDMGYEMTLRGETVSAATLYDNLIDSINTVYQDVVGSGNGIIDEVAHKTEFDLFNNPVRAIDGPCYAFLVHGKGPAVGGQGFVFNEGDDTTTSSNIIIKDNIINNIKCWVNEIPAVVESGTVVNDARGAVFQLVSSVTGGALALNPDGTYKGNVVADMQIMVAKAIQDGVLTSVPELQTEVNSINSVLIDWAMDGTTSYTPQYRCNGDSMHHVSKGMVVIRVEDSLGFLIRGNKINNVENLSFPPFEECADFHGGASSENVGEQQGGNIRAISVAAVRGFEDGSSSNIWDNEIMSAESAQANVIIGIDVQGDSKAVQIKDNVVDLNAGTNKIALRVRQFTDSTGDDAIDVKTNSFSNPVQILNEGQRRRLNDPGRKLLQNHHPNIDGLEWKLGGCPFAKAKGQVRAY